MIRNAVLKDVSRIAEILIFAKRSAYRNIFQNDKVTFGEMQVLPLALEYQNNPDLLKNIIVYDDEFVKGLVNIIERTNADGTTIIEIVEIYVDPFFQGSGIGLALLKEAERYGRNKKASGISLWVLEKNAKTRIFYEKYGLELSGEKKLEEGTTEYIVKYIKDFKLSDEQGS